MNFEKNHKKTAKTAKIRLDDLLVSRGLASNRTEAFKLILGGNVLVNKETVKDSYRKFANDVSIKIKQKRFVSRGGEKLDGALNLFNLNVTNMVCLDAGASTGGFSDCLISRNAKKVYAVDVASGIIAWKLRNHKQVVLIENQNIRFIDKTIIPEPIDLVTVDLSFISLFLAIPPLIPIVKPEGFFVILVKPQFEAKKNQVPKGGVIIDSIVHEQVMNRIKNFLIEQNLTIISSCTSPIKGTTGNTEFFIMAQKTR